MIWALSVGAFTVYAIEDGAYLRDPVATFVDSEPGAWEGQPGMVDGGLRVSFGCFLIADESRIVMVDSGVGPYSKEFPGEGGRLPAALDALGIEPSAIETVIHTHLHPDHFGGDRTPEGEPYFPNARLIVQHADYEYFTSDGEAYGSMVRTGFTPFYDAGLVDLFEGDGPIVPGFSAKATPGHTPGHMSVLVESRGNAVLVTGDSTHHPLQVRKTGWSSSGDFDTAQSARTRAELFAELAVSGVPMAGGHYPRPGFGKVEDADGELRFVPIDVEQVGQPSEPKVASSPRISSCFSASVSLASPLANRVK